MFGENWRIRKNRCCTAARNGAKLIFVLLGTGKENGRGPAEDDRGPDEDRPGEAEAEEEGGQESEVGAEDDFGKGQLPAKTFFWFCKSCLTLHFILSLILLGSLQLH